MANTRSSKRKRIDSDEPRKDTKRQSQAETNHSRRPSKKPIKHAQQASDTVLGGMRGGYRMNSHGVDPDEAENASNNASEMVEGTPNVQTFNIPFGDKSIVCQRHGSSDTKQQSRQSTTLIFTHGAGGGLSTPATQDFVSGFASIASPVVAFQGTMNLQSRVKTFTAVIEHLNGGGVAPSEQPDVQPALGGRSMGARAAVLAANDGETNERRPRALVLVSYPLLGGKDGDQVRDQILNEVSEDVDVLFVSGSKDKMCPLDRLQHIRKGMKAKTWCVTVDGADHGMGMTGSAKHSVSGVRKKSGEVAAQWLKERQKEKRECLLSWNEEDAEIMMGDWR